LGLALLEILSVACCAAMEHTVIVHENHVNNSQAANSRRRRLLMKLTRHRNSSFDPSEVHRRQSLKGLPLASFGRRAIAFLIDIGIVALLIGIYALPGTLQSMSKTGDFKMNIDPFHGWEILSLPLYFGLWTYFGHGQTPGKRLMKIRVISLVHEHLTLWHSVERSMGYGASILEGGFGFMQYFIHPNRQTVHDRIAETIVIKVVREPTIR
jgi:uncharacterized RDD family membrane protein YckC